MQRLGGFHMRGEVANATACALAMLVLGGAVGQAGANERGEVAPFVPAPWQFDPEHARVVGVHVLSERHFAGLSLDLKSSSVQSYVRTEPKLALVVGVLHSAQTPEAGGIAAGEAVRASFDWLGAGLTASRNAGDVVTVADDRQTQDDKRAWRLDLSWRNAATGVTSTVAAVAVQSAGGIALTYAECFHALDANEAGAAEAQRACDDALARVGSDVPTNERMAFVVPPRSPATTGAGDQTVGGATAADAATALAIAPRKTARLPFYLLGGVILAAGLVLAVRGARRKQKA
ncbi:MAG: hypothetical protein IPL79_18860 [Myxococcales bacterium]|nr:hypothetical protein [Myxococcales bacterium]